MITDENQKRVILRKEGPRWNVIFKGDFISGRDYVHLKRALEVRYRVYLRTRAVSKRKEVKDAAK